MDSVSFFTPYSFGEQSKTKGQWLLETIDDYFYLGGEKAKILTSQGVKIVKDSPSWCEVAAKVVSYILLAGFLLLIVKAILRSIYVYPHPSIAVIHSFWEDNIHSFRLSHGTSSIYYRHFKEHGITATYPEALHNTVMKIRKVWGDHERDIAAKTAYFKMFERRYDEARQRQEVAISFSANPEITHEFTQGERGGGGEWVKELGYFFREASYKQEVLTSEEQQTIRETQALIDVMRRAPAMVVKIKAEVLVWANVFNANSLLLPLDHFIYHVQTYCSEWQNPEKLGTYLHKTLLPAIQKEKENLRGRYEIPLSKPVRPEHLEFEFIATAFPKSSYPKLEFDKPAQLLGPEFANLQINRYGNSEIEEYRDSRFEYVYSMDGSYTVTRKKLSPEELRDLNERRAMRQRWLQAFACD